jgi:hypothetical protein
VGLLAPKQKHLPILLDNHPHAYSWHFQHGEVLPFKDTSW